MLKFLKRLGKSATLDAWSEAERRPVSGLIPIDMRIGASQATRARLALFTEAAEPVYSRDLALEPAGDLLRLIVHGQLLPNGPQTVRLTLSSAAGERLAERTLTLQVANLGPVAAAVAESLARSGAPLVFDQPCDSGAYDYADPALTPWFDRPEPEAMAHIAGLAAAGTVDAEEAEALRAFVRRGFLALPDVIAPEHLASLNAAVDDAVEKGREGYAWGSSRRMHGLHQHYPAIKALWLHPRVLKMLDVIFGAPARPCQSLTYVFGSQQEHHQDTIHLTPFPAGYMCGVWTALEDVAEDSGELLVFPGSHRLPRVYTATVGTRKVTDDDWSDFGKTVAPYWTDLINAAGFTPEVYRPKAGAVLIWHENLMHAGAVRRDLERSRRSIVCHYFAEGAVAYYDSSGAPGEMYMGPRE